MEIRIDPAEAVQRKFKQAFSGRTPAERPSIRELRRMKCEHDRLWFWRRFHHPRADMPAQ